MLDFRYKNIVSETFYPHFLCERLLHDVDVAKAEKRIIVMQ